MPRRPGLPHSNMKIEPLSKPRQGNNSFIDELAGEGQGQEIALAGAAPAQGPPPSAAELQAPAKARVKANTKAILSLLPSLRRNITNS